MVWVGLFLYWSFPNGRKYVSTPLLFLPSAMPLSHYRLCWVSGDFFFSCSWDPWLEKEVLKSWWYFSLQIQRVSQLPQISSSFPFLFLYNSSFPLFFLQTHLYFELSWSFFSPSIKDLCLHLCPHLLLCFHSINYSFSAN